MDRTAAIAVLQQAGIPVDGLDSTPDAFIVAIATLIQGQNPAAAVPPVAAATDQQMQSFAERFFRPMLRPIMEQVTAVNQRVAEADRRTVHQELLTFAETYKAKLFPYELDPTNPAYVVKALAALTPDQRRPFMDAITNRGDVQQFGERMTQVSTGQGGHGKVVPNNRTMSADRRRELLSLTPTGKAKLEQERIAAMGHN